MWQWSISVLLITLAEIYFSKWNDQILYCSIALFEHLMHPCLEDSANYVKIFFEASTRSTEESINAWFLWADSSTLWFDGRTHWTQHSLDSRLLIYNFEPCSDAVSRGVWVWEVGFCIKNNVHWMVRCSLDPPGCTASLYDD